MTKSKAKATGAIELLKEQHDKVKKAFKEFEKLDREDTEKQQQLVAERVRGPEAAHHAGGGALLSRRRARRSTTRTS